MSQFSEFIIDQLQEIGIVEEKKMFGGYGLRLEGVFFGIIHDERLYFKISENTKKKYEKAGMQPFSPNKKQTLLSYYEVPISVIEDSEVLCKWASDAIAAQIKTE